MVGKKSIFEKLGLVEPVDEDGNPIESNEDTKNTEENITADTEKEETPSDIFKAERSQSAKGAQEENFEKESEVNSAREKLDKIEAMSEIEREAATLQIEDKLEELIGAYEKNKLMTVDDIYRSSRMETDTKRTIFMADVLKTTLPENLPADMKRESVLNIMKVSNINMDDLLNDAYKRIDALNKVLEDTAQTTEEIVQKNESSIRELEARIQELKDMVSARQQFNEEQNSLIEYEIQRVIGIVDFIKPKK